MVQFLVVFEFLPLEVGTAVARRIPGMLSQVFLFWFLLTYLSHFPAQFNVITCTHFPLCLMPYLSQSDPRATWSRFGSIGVNAFDAGEHYA